MQNTHIHTPLPPPPMHTQTYIHTDVPACDIALCVMQEPVSLYDERKVVPLSKLDRTASQATIKYYIDEEMAK